MLLQRVKRMRRRGLDHLAVDDEVNDLRVLMYDRVGGGVVTLIA
ncbi:MAG: hypothetical protein U0670_23945 [Anaerolineae bacterium]